MNPELLQLVVAGILGGGLASAIVSLFGKKVRSPESQNELAKIGNEFAAILLKQAQEERDELRKSIKELEGTNVTKQETIDRLNKILEAKDDRIEELEARQRVLAHKLQTGQKISLVDIFGPDAPNIHIVVEGNVA